MGGHRHTGRGTPGKGAAARLAPSRVLLLTLLALAPARPGASAVTARESPAEAERPPGRLRGNVIVGPQLEARKIRFQLYPDVGPAATAPEFSAAGEMKNVVIYLEGKEAAAPRPAAPLRIEQRDESFVPHVLPVAKGSVVEFTNLDPIYHNVFSLSQAASFDLGRYPRGESRRVRFDRPGIVRVFCHIHSDMSAVILVLDGPYFAMPGADGGYEIAGIPPGTYTVTAWHERAHPIRREVTIAPGRPTAADFTIPLEDAPRP